MSRRVSDYWNAESDAAYVWVQVLVLGSRGLGGCRRSIGGGGGLLRGFGLFEVLVDKNFDDAFDVCQVVFQLLVHLEVSGHFGRLRLEEDLWSTHRVLDDDRLATGSHMSLTSTSLTLGL